MTRPISLGFLVGSTYKPLIKTLSLNFLAGTTLDSRVTFSRASNATLVDSTGKLTYAPNNLVLRSEEFDNASWTKTSGRVIPTSETTAPDGTLTAFKHIPNAGIIMGAGASETRVFQDVAAIIGVKYIYSMYAKAAEYDQIQFSIIATPSANVTFSLTLGTIIGGGAGGIASITPVGNGWYRCSFSLPAGVTTVQVRFSAEDSTAFENRGNGTSGIYVWGAQFERATYQTVPSAYNRTVASAYHGPRLDYDPVTLAPDGLLIEEQRVNLMFPSDGITGWTPSPAGCVTATANAAVSPDGNSNATKLATGDTASNGHLWYKSFSGAVSTTYTGSVYLEAGEYTRAEIGFENTGFAGALYYALFNLSNGTVVATSASTTATITNAGNGWYRCTVTATSDADGGAYVFAVAPKPASVTTVSANYTPASVGLGIFLYGVQVETGAFATSFIPTGSAQATRTADNASMTGTNFYSWYNQSEGTIVVECNQVAGANSTSSPYAISDNTFNNSMYGNYASGNSFRGANLVVGGTGQAGDITTFSVSNVAVPIKNAFAYAVNNFGESLGGQTARTDTVGVVNTASNRMYLGSNWSGSGNYLNGHLRSISYYPVRWADAQLPSLTI